jgi:fluoride exporter
VIARRRSRTLPGAKVKGEGMARILFIFLAGGLGTLSRYGVGVFAGRTFGTTFPSGTLIVNVVGCFLIAVIAHAAALQVISPTLRLILATGFVGGLTTYSSFNLETTQLLQNRAWYSGFLNVGVTALGCFVAGLLGFALARRVLGP